MIRPCPFCGGAAESAWQPFDGSFAVVCEAEQCGAEINGCRTQAVATRRWNKRAKPIEPEPTK